jgi:hypothetical protein
MVTVDRIATINRASLLLFALVAAVTVACTSQPGVRTSLPGNIQIQSAEAGIPEPVAACLGVWSGRWAEFCVLSGCSTSGAELSLIVHRVTRRPNDQYSAQVTVIWKEGLKPEQRVREITVPVDSDGTLHLDNPNDGSSSRYQITADRQRMDLEYVGIEPHITQHIRMSGTLWRIEGNGAGR